MTDDSITTPPCFVGSTPESQRDALLEVLKPFLHFLEVRDGQIRGLAEDIYTVNTLKGSATLHLDQFRETKRVHDAVLYEKEHSKQEPIIELALCEQNHLVLKEGVLYRFTAIPHCKECRKLAGVYGGDENA